MNHSTSSGDDPWTFVRSESLTSQLNYPVISMIFIHEKVDSGAQFRFHEVFQKPNARVTLEFQSQSVGATSQIFDGNM